MLFLGESGMHIGVNSDFRQAIGRIGIKNCAWQGEDQQCGVST